MRLAHHLGSARLAARISTTFLEGFTMKSMLMAVMAVALRRRREEGQEGWEEGWPRDGLWRREEGQERREEGRPRGVRRREEEGREEGQV